MDVRKANHDTAVSKSYTDKQIKSGQHEDKIVMRNIRRGEVLFVRLDKGIGSEQGGSRFCVVIQNDDGNRNSSTIIVAFITSDKKKKKLLPVHVPVEKGICGLRSDSIIMLEQLRTLDKSRIETRKGILNDDIMDKIDEAIEVSLKNKKRKKKKQKVNILEEIPEETRSYLLNRLVLYETGQTSIQFLREIHADEETIKRALARKHEEHSDLLYYCHKHNINFEEVWNGYKGMKPIKNMEMII